MLKLDEKTLKALHSRANLRRFLEHVTHGQIDKITKSCAKGLDPNFHCQDTGGMFNTSDIYFDGGQSYVLSRFRRISQLLIQDFT